MAQKRSNKSKKILSKAKKLGSVKPLKQAAPGNPSGKVYLRYRFGTVFTTK